MARRFEITESVADRVTGRPISGATVLVKDLAGNELTLYDSESGVGTIDNPTTSGASGQIDGPTGDGVFVDAPDYNLEISRGPQTYTQRIRSSEVVDARSYGLSPSGTTAQNNTALQAALTAGAGQRVRVPPGSYALSAQMLLSSGTTLQIDEGATLDFSAGPTSGSCITVTGTGEATGVALTGNAAAGASSLTVAAGAEAGFAAGDWVRVQSNAFYGGVTDPIGGVDQYIGERVRVLSTASGTINLEWPLAGGPYNTADAATVSKLTMASDITIEGRGTIRGGVEASVDQWAIGLLRCVHARVRDIRIEHFDDIGVSLNGCVDVVVDAIHAVAGVGAQSALSYGVSINRACQDCSVINSYFRDWRHAITSSGGMSVGDGGINRRIAYSGNHAVRTRAAAFDAHSGVEDLTVVGNTSYGCAGGVNLRCPQAAVFGNAVRRSTAYGIRAQNQSAQPTAWTIVGNVVKDCADQSIVVLMGPPDTFAGVTVDGIAITGNVIQGGLYGIYVASGQTDSIAGVVVSDNSVRAPVNEAIYVSQANGVLVSTNLVRAAPAGGILLTTVLDAMVSANNVRATGGNGIALAGNCDDVTVVDNRTEAPAASGISIASTAINCRVKDNDGTGSNVPLSISAGTGNVVKGNLPVSTGSVASAATVTLPEARDFIVITGTTNITSITASWRGRVVTLVFNGILTVTDGSNLRLAGNLVTGANTTVTLMSDGTNWLEMARSVN